MPRNLEGVFSVNGFLASSFLVARKLFLRIVRRTYRTLEIGSGPTSSPIFSRRGSFLRRLLLGIAKKTPISREIFFIYMEESGPLRLRLGREYLEEIRNLYRGRRGFIVGNGPSLRPEILDSLVGEISIASNMIHLAFEDTPFRPTFFTVADVKVWDKLGPADLRHYDRIILSGALDPRRTNKPVSVIPQLSAVLEEGSQYPFSVDLLEGAYNGYTVSYLNLQLAYYLGLNPVYLVGFDHRYQQKPGKSRLVRELTGENHFSQRYRTPGEVVFRAPLDKMTRAFEAAQVFAKRNDWRIVNLTPGSSLEVFEKHHFEDVIQSLDPTDRVETSSRGMN